MTTSLLLLLSMTLEPLIIIHEAWASYYYVVFLMMERLRMKKSDWNGWKEY